MKKNGPLTCYWCGTAFRIPHTNNKPHQKLRLVVCPHCGEPLVVGSGRERPLRLAEILAVTREPGCLAQLAELWAEIKAKSAERN